MNQQPASVPLGPATASPVSQIEGGGVTIGGALRQRFEANPLQLLGNLVVELPRRARLTAGDLVQ